MTVEKEFEGKNIATAVKNACKHLNIPEEELKYEVLSHGSSGIFGIVGVKKARISVLIKEDSNKETSADERLIVEKDKDGSNEDFEPQEVEIEPDKERVIDPNAGDIAADQSEHVKDFSPEEAMELGKAVLQRMGDAITEGVQIRVEKKKNTICYDIDCVESGNLIGKKGNTLDAMQYLVERMLAGKIDAKTRLRVDVCGYRNKRKAQILKLAEIAAKKVQQNRKPVPLGLFNPEERRILQASMRNRKVFCRASKKEGYLKKIILFPQKPQAQEPDTGMPQE